MRKPSILSCEIAGMLIMKLIIIYVIWSICFSYPVDKNLTADNISAHIFNLNKGHS